MKTISLTLSEEVYISVKRLAEDEGAKLTSFLAALIADELMARFKKKSKVLKDITSHNEHQKSKKTLLRVTFPDGHVLEDRFAADTFIKTLSKIGFEKVESLGILVRGIPLVGLQKSLHYQQRRVGGRLIITNSSTYKKKDTLEEISRKLDVGLKIEIVK